VLNITRDKMLFYTALIVSTLVRCVYNVDSTPERKPTDDVTNRTELEIDDAAKQMIVHTTAHINELRFSPDRTELQMRPSNNHNVFCSMFSSDWLIIKRPHRRTRGLFPHANLKDAEKTCDIAITDYELNIRQYTPAITGLVYMRAPHLDGTLVVYKMQYRFCNVWRTRKYGKCSVSSNNSKRYACKRSSLFLFFKKLFPKGFSDVPLQENYQQKDLKSLKIIVKQLGKMDTFTFINNSVRHNENMLERVPDGAHIVAYVNNNTAETPIIAAIENVNNEYRSYVMDNCKSRTLPSKPDDDTQLNEMRRLTLYTFNRLYPYTVRYGVNCLKENHDSPNKNSDAATIGNMMSQMFHDLCDNAPLVSFYLTNNNNYNNNYHKVDKDGKLLSLCLTYCPDRMVYINSRRPSLSNRGNDQIYNMEWVVFAVYEEIAFDCFLQNQSKLPSIITLRTANVKRVILITLKKKSRSHKTTLQS